MRIIGLDLGEKRIGVAAADDRTGVALPVTTVNAVGDPAALVASILREQSADEVVVGLPLSMSGAVGPQAEKVLALVEELREIVAIPIHTWDERLSSVQASRSPGRPTRRKSNRTADAGRDAAAAAIVLQAYLDSRRSPVR
jgi:putative Holliday junction resolvase